MSNFYNELIIPWSGFLYWIFFLILISIAYSTQGLGLVPNPAFLIGVFYLIICIVYRKFPFIDGVVRPMLATGIYAIIASLVFFLIIFGITEIAQLKVFPIEINVFTMLNFFITFIYAFAWNRLGIITCENDKRTKII